MAHPYLLIFFIRALSFIPSLSPVQNPDIPVQINISPPLLNNKRLYYILHIVYDALNLLRVDICPDGPSIILFERPLMYR